MSFIEYLGFLPVDKNEVIDPNPKIENDKEMPSILCLTFIKNDVNLENYSNLKKIKFYVKESNGKIIKFLQN